MNEEHQRVFGTAGTRCRTCNPQRGQVTFGAARPWGSTWIGVLLLLVALILDVVMWVGTGEWTKDKVCLEFALVILGCLL